jgi:hypothetical protein
VGVFFCEERFFNRVSETSWPAAPVQAGDFADTAAHKGGGASEKRQLFLKWIPETNDSIY